MYLPFPLTSNLTRDLELTSQSREWKSFYESHIGTRETIFMASPELKTAETFQKTMQDRTWIKDNGKKHTLSPYMMIQFF